MSKVYFRQSQDYKKILKLNDQIFPDEPYEIKDLGAYWLGKVGNRSVAFCGLHTLMHEPDTCFFSRAGVLPSYRKLKLHKRMIQIRVRAAKAAGLERAVTYAQMENGPSIANLIKCGFKIFTPHYWDCGEDMIYFELKL